MRLNFKEFKEVLNTPKYGAISNIYELITKGENEEISRLYNNPEREAIVREAVAKIYTPELTSEDLKNQRIREESSQELLIEVLKRLNLDVDNVASSSNLSGTQYKKEFSTADLFLTPSLQANVGSKTVIIDQKFGSSSKYIDDGFTSKKEKYFTFESDSRNFGKGQVDSENVILDYVYALNKNLPEGFEKNLEKRVKRFSDRATDLGASIYRLALIKKIRTDEGLDESNTVYMIAAPSSKYVKGSILEEESILIDLIDVSEILETAILNVKEDFELIEKHLNQKDITEDMLLGLLEKDDFKDSIYSELVTPIVPQTDSVFELMGRQYGFLVPDEEFGAKKKINVNQLFMEYPMIIDVPNDVLTRFEQQVQKEVLLTGKPYFDKEKINLALNLLKYPLYHLDFETLALPIPLHKGEGVHVQSLFQYSIHIEKEPGVCDLVDDNTFYISDDHKKDNRKELLVKLLKDLNSNGVNGSIIVYNESFEKKRLEELALIFPEFNEEIKKVLERIVDLMHFVKGNTKFDEKLIVQGLEPAKVGKINYYDASLNGSYSLKKVLPALTNDKVSYADLEIRDGNQAVENFLKLNSSSKEEKEIITENLYKYCRLDTYAMVEVLRALRNI